MRLPKRRLARVAVFVGAGMMVVLVLAQAVPYGRSHTNPPVTKEPAWDSAQTRALAVRACFDCHSNLTKWPWYTNVAPVSWLSQHDVDGGRSAFNLSRWDRPQDVGAGDIVDAINGGGMPPWFYVLLHSSAGLSKAEKAQLAAGMAKTLAASPPLGGGGG